jgi:tripartite-type tricarboxylate transporter receptor subunit TctC
VARAGAHSRAHLLRERRRWQGRRLAGFRRRSAVAHGDVKSPAAVIRWFHSPELRDISERLVERLGLSGLFATECIVDEKTGHAYLIEINRRLTPGMHVGSRIDVDLAAALHAALTAIRSKSRTDPDPGEEGSACIFRRNGCAIRKALPARYPVDVPWDDPICSRPWSHCGSTDDAQRRHRGGSAGSIARHCCIRSSPLAHLRGADPYPSRALRIVVSFPPGTTTDTLARTVAQRLGEALGESGDRRELGRAPRATSGSPWQRKPPPDGYTLTIGGAAMCINPAIYGKRVVDPVHDFAPVAKLASSPIVIVAHPSVRANTLQELIELARNTPQKLAYSTPGVGTPTPRCCGAPCATREHPAAAHSVFPVGTAADRRDQRRSAGCVHAAWRGTTFSQERAIEGDRDNRQRARRSRCPTPDGHGIGLPGYEVTTWYSVLVPAGTPAAVIDRLNHALVRSIALPTCASA